MRRLSVGDRVAVLILVAGVLAGTLAVVLGGPAEQRDGWRVVPGERLPAGVVELLPGRPLLAVTSGSGVPQRLVRRGAGGRFGTVARGRTITALPAARGVRAAIVTDVLDRPVLLLLAPDGRTRRVALSTAQDGRSVVASTVTPDGDVALITRRCPAADGPSCERPRPLELLIVHPDGSREPVVQVTRPRVSGGQAAAVVSDARGGLLVVSTDDGVLQVRSRPPAGELGPADRIADVADRVGLAVDARADGGAVVAWTTQSVGEGRAGALSARAAVRIAGDFVFGRPQLLDPGLRPRGGEEQDGIGGLEAGLDVRGQATVLWAQGLAFDGVGLRAATSGPSGTFGPPQTLVPVRGDDADAATLTVAADGAAVAVWQRQGDGGLRLARRGPGRARFGDTEEVPGVRFPLDLRVALGASGSPSLTGIDQVRDRRFRARPDRG